MSNPKMVVIKSSFTSMQENMRTNVAKGGCEATGHWGITQDGRLQMGGSLGGHSYMAPDEGDIKVLLFGEPNEEMFEALDYLTGIYSLITPQLSGVRSPEPKLNNILEERYG